MSLQKEFINLYFSIEELKILAKQLELKMSGNKTDLTNRISSFIKYNGDIEKVEKEENKIIVKSLIPKKVPQKLSLDTKLKEGFTSNLETRNFFKKYTSESFHFTYHLLEFIKSNPNKTYKNAIQFWLNWSKNKDKYKDVYEETGKFQYNNFMRKYKGNGLSLKDITEKWNDHLEKRNKNKQNIIKKILKLKN